MESKPRLKSYPKLYFKSSAKIIIDLQSEATPNAVNSLIYVASYGWTDYHAVQRIALGKWVDLSYNTFRYGECHYSIPDEFQLNPNLKPLILCPGIICMGGYDEIGLMSAEIFFPLKGFPKFRGIYPVFDEVIEGVGEMRRIAEPPAREAIHPDTDKKILEPAKPQIIERVELELFGETCPALVWMEKQNPSPC